MDAKMMKTKQPFVPPTMEVIVFHTEDIITTSGGVRGGFEGEWDLDIPEV